jgi:transposase
MNEQRRRLVYQVVLRNRRGESQRAISRALGIARKTVKGILEDEEKRREEGESAVQRELVPPRAPRASKLDAYEEQLQGWLEQYPDLTAVRALEKLQEKGFDGQYTIVREWLKEHRGPCQPKQAVEIVETPPGQQAQFDWSPYTLGEALEVQLWSCTLKWSRGRSFLASQNTRQSTIMRCLLTSFEDFGGVPQECVTDSMPGVVDRWEANQPILNVRFVDFAAYYNFAVHIAPRGDGAYKGGVERPFRYHEENLLNGRTFHSFEQYRDKLAWWVRERAMQRPHPVTGRPLTEMLAEERPYLQPLPAHPYDTRDVVIRLVEATGHVRHESNLYRVPDEHIGELLYVCVGPDQLEIVDRRVHRIARYERLPDGARQRLGDDRFGRRRRRYDVILLTQRLEAWGEVAADFARRLRDRKRYAGPELSYVLDLQLTWSADDIAGALEHAMRYEAYDARAVQRILEARYTPRTLAEQVAESTRGRIRDAMKDHPVGVRPLTSYTALRHGDAHGGSPTKEPPDDHD